MCFIPGFVELIVENDFVLNTFVWKKQYVVLRRTCCHEILINATLRSENMVWFEKH